MFTRVVKSAGWYITLIVVPFGFVAVLNQWFVSVADLDSPYMIKEATLDGESIRLPDFMHSRKTVPPSVWYRIEASVDHARHVPWAVYLVGPAAKYSVFVNGQFIGESGDVGVSMPQYVGPLIFRFPGELMRTGSNRIELHAVSDSRRSVLQSVQVGPDSALTRSFDTAEFALLTLKQMTVAGLIAMGIVMLVLSGSRSRESIFGWYSIALFFMSAHIGFRLMPSVPFGDAQLWKNSVDLALIGYIACTAFFVDRLLNVAGSRFETWLSYWSLLGAAVLVLDPLLFDSSVPWFFHRVWLPATLPIWLYQSWLAAKAVRAAPSLDSRFLAVLYFIGIMIGTCDGLIGFVSLSSTVYLPYAMGPVLLVVWVALIRMFVVAVNTAESTRQELERRVREQTQELKESLVRMKDMEREQALSTERERIMRDMHDGVGAQLVQALSIATSKPELKSIEEPLRGCLEELRLIIDSIEPINGNLASVLGTLRMRMTRRLSEAAIQLRWRVDDIPILSDFGPSRVLHVLRILHEAIANALKHSRAKQIMLSAHMVVGDRQSSVVIEVSDDGAGARAAQGGGHGLENMRRRAEELKASLTVDFGSQGTKVRLVLPVESIGSRDLEATQAPNLA